MKTPRLCVLDTSVASDVQAAGLWGAVTRIDVTVMVPQVVAFTEFRQADLAGAQGSGMLVEPSDEKEESAAASFTRTFRKPSPNDLAALALAKSRGATLLTGDGHLREAAAAEGVTVHGVLWLLDVLVAKAAITAEIAAVALAAILADGSRLPDHECQQRLRAWGR